MPHVVHTKPREERKAEKHLKEQGIRTFLPLCRKPRSLETVPLFPRYLFFWLVPGGAWWPIINTPGVSYPIRGADLTLAEVPEEVVEGIRRRMEADGGAILLEDRLPARKFLRPGQEIQVVGGSYTGLRGVFVSRSGERIKALLTMFGRSVQATVNEANVA